MTLEQRLERVYRVRFDEAGPDGTFRSSGFLRFAQDLAWLHSESAGFGREWYSERGLFWLVRGVELDIVGSVDYGSDVVVSTEVIGFRRVIARRLSEFHLAGSERPVAVALTDWVLLNDAGRPVRPPAEIPEAFVSNSDFTQLRAQTGEVPGDAHEREFRVRRSEADPMAHVNNAGYIDYLDEQYLESLGSADDASMPVPRRYRAEFVASATPGLRLVGRSWATDAGWRYRLADENGRELFRASLEADPASWIGG
ncbi:MAG TPA: acyl-ACP thioesterase domain-containing protein [Candidatus Limnocylindrales bacterium]